jgi:hypothetical protein
MKYNLSATLTYFISDVTVDAQNEEDAEQKVLRAIDFTVSPIQGVDIENLYITSNVQQMEVVEVTDNCESLHE